MTNRNPHVPEDQREEYAKSCFHNEPAKADKPKAEAKPAAKPAPKKAVKRSK
jgi:hypothetical protein